MKTYEGVKIQLHTLLTWTSGKGDWSGLCPEQFGHGETIPSVHLRDWLGRSTGLDTVENSKTCAPAGNYTSVPHSSSMYLNHNSNTGTEHRTFLLCDASL